MMQLSENIAANPAELNEREKDILRSIVNLYSENGEPVGSHLVSRLLGDFSSATIRNIFASIEEKGFIRKSHCSSGRIPTDAGLRYFVDNILKVRKIAATDKQHIDDRSETLRADLPSLMTAIPEMISELSHYTGFVLTKESRMKTIRHIDFVPAGPRRVLVILVDSLGGISNRVVELAEEPARDELEKLRNFINAHLTDKTLFDIKGHFLRELHTLKEKYEQLLDRILLAAQETVHTSTSGETNVFDYIGATETRQIKMLLENFRRNQFYLDLFNRVADSRDVRIFIGAESDLFCTAECSAILSTYEIPDGELMGVVGVIGPRRMNYAKMIPIIDYTRNLLISSTGLR